MRSFVGRIRKLENRGQKGERSCVVIYDPLRANADEVLQTVGQPGGRYMLVPDFGSDEEWERKAMAQQQQLLFESRGKST